MSAPIELCSNVAQKSRVFRIGEFGDRWHDEKQGSIAVLESFAGIACSIPINNTVAPKSPAVATPPPIALKPGDTCVRTKQNCPSY